MFVTLVGVFVLVLVHIADAQNSSPCPEIFSYEPRGREDDRWYGVISLQSKDDLDGVWLKIILDRPADLLGNWFGETVSNDNEEFTVRNPKYKLEAGPPVSVRFFVKYNAASTIPSLTGIKLNGKTICSTRRDETVPTSEPLYISRPSRPSNRPTGRPGTSEEGVYVNNREPTTSQERPLSHDTNSHSNSVSNGSRRPSNNNNDYNNHNNNNNYKPSSQGSSGSSSNSRGGSGSSSNSNTGSSSSSRRPSGSSSSSHTPSSHNSRDREPTNSGSTSNHLSAEVDTTPDGNDFFPGDFVALGSPNPSRQPPRRPTIIKRNVGCGTVAMKPRPLISFGQNTTQGEWPWHAALYYAQGAQLMYTCGATLISEEHIITAAHCVAKPQTNRPIDTKKLAVYLGKYSLKKFGPEIQDREVSRIFIHPSYNYSVYFNDIAVLKLKEPIDLTNYVRPCCLWEGDTELRSLLNKTGTVVGWGFDENREISDNLMQAQMPIVSHTTCIYSNREFFSHFLFEKTYCAGFRNGTTVCNGDSGGGMVFPRSSNGNTVWQIRGIVSVGVALQGQGVCDPKHYIVFTDVATHLDWIKKVMDQ